MDSHKKISDVYNSKSIKNAAYSSFFDDLLPSKTKAPALFIPSKHDKT